MATIEEVRDTFESWRVNRASKNTPLPEFLWSLAKELVPHYKRSHIQRALRINSAQFKEHCLASVPIEDEPSALIEDSGFVSGYYEPIEHKAPNEPCELTLQGMHKTLHIKATLPQLSHILSLVERYL
jgi:hypothetical protein